jgi:spore coat protein JB
MLHHKMKDRRCGEGRLPAMAPLANPYVPFQVENPPTYEPRTALVRGTLFPGLDLPFMGMVNKNEKPVTPLTELQTVAFVIQELALYLDTHRDDTEALDVYRQMQKMYQKAAEEYEKKCGPLTHKAPLEGPYRWLDDPWPWEYAKNREA